MARDNRNLYGPIIKAALPPVTAIEEPVPSRSFRESVRRMDREATLLEEEIRGHPFHYTLAELAERLR
jgi:hypothetical protein